MNHVRRATAMAAGAVVILAATGLPAMANNVDLAVGRGGVHHGLWTDSIDRLGACLGGTENWIKAVVTIKPADGAGPEFSVTDKTSGNGCVYTGNLSIPEDERYIMTVFADSVWSGGDASGSTSFYT